MVYCLESVEEYDMNQIDLETYSKKFKRLSSLLKKTSGAIRRHKSKQRDIQGQASECAHLLIFTIPKVHSQILRSTQERSKKE